MFKFKWFDLRLASKYKMGSSNNNNNNINNKVFPYWMNEFPNETLKWNNLKVNQKVKSDASFFIFNFLTN